MIMYIRICIMQYLQHSCEAVLEHKLQDIFSKSFYFITKIVFVGHSVAKIRRPVWIIVDNKWLMLVTYQLGADYKCVKNTYKY